MLSAWRLVLGAGMYLLLSTPPSIGNLSDAHKTNLSTDSHRWAATREETEMAAEANKIETFNTTALCTVRRSCGSTAGEVDESRESE